MSLWVRTILLSGLADGRGEAVEGHERQLAELRRQGKLRLAGRFAAGDGYLEILEVADRLEAEAITRTSPLVERGLGSWMLREWVELD